MRDAAYDPERLWRNEEIYRRHLFNSDEADLYSTAMFLMTPEEAMAFAEKYKLRAIVVDRDGNLHDFGPIE